MSEKKQVVAKRFKMNFAARMVNGFISFLLRMGFKVKSAVGYSALLTVKGRKTGVAHTNPVQIVEYHGRRYLIAAYGEVNWVRNLRTSHEASIFHDGKSEVVSASEINPLEAAPILKYSLSSHPAYTRSYFQAKSDSPIELFQEDAIHHPVFEVK
jgi:deazaflavin-dependent oxidoreductase (nitroreductase family)